MPHMVQQLPPICKNIKQFSRENLQHFSLRWFELWLLNMCELTTCRFPFSEVLKSTPSIPLKAPAALPWRLWQTAAAPATMKQWHPWTPASERRWCFFCGPMSNGFSHEALHWLVGGFNPSEKYESQLGWLFPMENKIHVPNHQPDW